MKSPTEKLCDDLEQFCRREGLECNSADEMLLETSLTAGQRTWLEDFVTRWDAAVLPMDRVGRAAV